MSSISAPSARRLPAPGGAHLWVPCLIVFFSGVCIMTIELVASRLVSGYVGMSLYIWTSVIGVILAGISLGNSLGGRLADRFESKRLVAALFALAGGLCYATLPTVQWIGGLTSDWISTEPKAAWLPSPWTARVITVVSVTFFLPGTAIGMITPAIAKWALDCGLATGNTVGTVYAWNNIGSILGTFLAGFYLLDRFEVDAVIMIASGLLLLGAAGFVPAVLLSGNRRDINPTRRDRTGIVRADDRKPSGLWVPGLVVFTTGFCIMMIELVISRLVAGHIGQSLYTWTSVIGVVLAGISLGNYMGGRLADQCESKQLVGTLFLLASPVCLSVLTSHHMVSNATASWLDIDWSSQAPAWAEAWVPSNWAIRVITVIFVAFFFPATVLGAVSPVVAKWALDRGYATGRTVGVVYAWNTAGSIVGTFATGFFLISALYVSRLIAVSALVLAVIAALFMAASGWLVRILAGLWLAACASFVAFVFMPVDSFEEAVLSLHPVELNKVSRHEASELLDDLAEVGARLDKNDPAQRETAAALDELHSQLSELTALATQNQRSEIDIATVQLGEKLRALRSRMATLGAGATQPSESGSIPPIRRLRSAYNELFAKREREVLKFAAAVFGRDEEINLYDQYNFRDDFEYYDESNYYTIQVGEDTVDSNKTDDYELDADGNPVMSEGRPRRRQRTIRQLVLDALVHGYIDMADYSYLHYEYEHIYASISHRILRRHRAEQQKLKVLFLGGGSYTFPRYLSEYYPEIHCDVAEIDPRVTQTARRALGMNALRGKRIYLLADEAVAEFAVAPVSGWTAPVHAVWRAYRIAPSPSRPSRTFYVRRIEQAGAIKADQLDESVDFVLDLGQNPVGADRTRERAAQLKIPMIGPADFERLLDTTSHENVVTHHMDARQFVMRESRLAAQNPAYEKYDVIYGDAFNDFSVPAHLTTLEFNRQMAGLLKDDGIFMANVIDIWRVSKFMGAYWNTLNSVFRHVYLFATDAEPGESRSTFVIICSNQPVDVSEIGRRPGEAEFRGLVGVLMEDRLLEPVVRGGLWPIGSKTLTADGSRTEWTLPRAAHDAAITISRTPDDSEFKLERGDQLVFVEPPPKNARIDARLFGRQNLGSEEFISDGEQTSFNLPQSCASVRVTIKTKNGERQLSADEFSLESSSIVALPKPLGKGVKIHVTRYGDRLFPLQRVKLRADGEEREFDLPRVCLDVKMTIRYQLEKSEYSLTNEGRTLVLHRAPKAGATIRIKLYGDRKVLLTDNYSPVDNMLADVAATRGD